ncbi:MAG: NAD(P)-binding protein [Candidatus Marinimicrobia bacterium]|nr:NAD(P)-binding protein [Candidatus Neomarinimicrobiota bacterium]
MAKKLNITRRDFMNGVAMGLTAGTAVSPLELLAMNRQSSTDALYPPELIGMRGSHPGSFEVAHALARNGARWTEPIDQTDRNYDLVIVGGGISGLSAAHLYKQRHGKDSRILILDNHDDFGGHAKRNEFTVDGKQLICYGGSQSIAEPSSWSPVGKKLLKDVGVHTERFYDYFDRNYFKDRKLGRGLYFSRDQYGKDYVSDNILGAEIKDNEEEIIDLINAYPIAEASKTALIKLLSQTENYLLGMESQEDKINLLRQTSYSDFLRKYVNVSEEVVLLYRDMSRGLWGIGWDALSALDAYKSGMPGTLGLNLKIAEQSYERDEPYIFHFPDGNAGFARSIVRELIPSAISGTTMEDLVKARVDYAGLDLDSLMVRIRLNSTVVKVEHTPNEKAVDVTYIKDGNPHRVRGAHVIMACYNNIIPNICPEVPDAQKEAIAYATKMPLVYISVAVRNWNAFSNLGYRSFYIPQPSLMHSFGLDFPVSMGGYNFTQNPDEPTVIHGTYVPLDPDKGLNAREQCIAGRIRLYEMSFDDFEKNIVSQLSGALRDGGFDAERDIAAITVNRWPHGYAYEYLDYSDPVEFNPNNGPHIAGRAQIGRISIANSDASAYAYLTGAIDAADRAVNEQLMV